MSTTLPRRAVLLAAQPDAFHILAGMLGGLFEIHEAHTIRDALATLERHQRIALIICTVAFDDSRLFEFLQLVRDREATRDIPFIGCRVIASVLSDDSIDRLGQAFKFFGATEFVDIARLENATAAALLKNVVMKHIGSD